MSYLCGLGPGIPGGPRDPVIICDGCGAEKRITYSHVPPLWFMDGKAPPGWKGRRHTDGRREDYCPTCKKGRKG